MPYVAVDQWAHGDKPTAAKLNKWKSGLEAIYAKTGDRAFNLPCTKNVDDGVGDDRYFIHTHRYLHFRGDAGQIIDPSGAGDPVGISETDNAFTVYDLDGVSWLQYGMLYYVHDAQYAIEWKDA